MASNLSVGERSLRSMGLGTNEDLARPLWPETWNDDVEKAD
jgi:hypothetical protein